VGWIVCVVSFIQNSQTETVMHGTVTITTIVPVLKVLVTRILTAKACRYRRTRC